MCNLLNKATLAGGFVAFGGRTATIGKLANPTAHKPDTLARYELLF